MTPCRSTHERVNVRTHASNRPIESMAQLDRLPDWVISVFGAGEVGRALPIRPDVRLRRCRSSFQHGVVPVADPSHGDSSGLCSPLTICL